MAAIALFFSSFTASATNPEAADPCKRASGLTTRDQILAAVPAADESWGEALRRRGLAKNENGEWLQYFNGGNATASNRAFVAAFEDFCTAKARAATAVKTTPRAKTDAAAPVPVAVVERRNEVQVAEAKVKRESLMSKAAAFIGGLVTAAPPPEKAAPAELVCRPDLCVLAADCEAAGIEPGKLVTETRCGRARLHKEAGCCK